MAKKSTVGEYLVARLTELGVGHVFGIPGDYVLGFYDRIVESRLELVGTCTEIGAGYAADAYARANGLGCVCVTYCVGGLNVVNAIGGAYAEKSPVVVISGAPGMSERAVSPLLHHQVRDFRTQLSVYEKVTVAAVAIEDPAEAPRLIDETLNACLEHKRPVFIELPRDVVDKPCPPPTRWRVDAPLSDADALSEAIAETSDMLKAAKRPAILAGVEIHRFGLQETLLRLVKKTGYPVATTLLGKSIISERHPQFVGVYQGAMGRAATRRAVERADVLLVLGAFMTDMNLGVGTADLDPVRTIDANSERISIRHHHFDDVVLEDFVEGLISARLGPRRDVVTPARAEPKPFRPSPSRPMTIARLFARMNEFIDENTMVICDIGDSLFGGSDLTIHRRTEFMCPAYYTSMGFAVPASLGAQMARRGLRPVVFVGDGAFQMTGQELSSIANQGLNPIVFVLNNEGYTTERYIREGPYNDIRNWRYHLMPELLGGGLGIEVATEGEFEAALETARAHTSSFVIVNVHLQKMDASPALKRLGEGLAKRSS